MLLNHPLSDPSSKTNKFSFILEGVDTLLQNSPGALYDRVINLRFTRTNQKTKTTETFIIRSDYEVVRNEQGSFYIEKMKIKPNIKVVAKQVAQNTYINVSVYVTNFHMFSSVASNEEFTYDKNPISNIEIQMGYFGQFKKPTTLEEYNNIGASYGFSKYITKTVVLSAYMIKMPPDSVTCFECVVGETLEGLDVEKNKVKSKEETEVLMRVDKTNLKTVQDLVFETVTRRFPSPDLSPEQKSQFVLSTSSMSVAEAQLKGVPVYFTSNAAQEDFGGHKGKSEDADVFTTFTMPYRTTVLGTLLEIQKLFPRLRFVERFDGAWIAYSTDDKEPKDISTDIKGTHSLIIPAIYSLTFGATQTIKTPYFGFINTFDELKFESRYNLAKMIGYYYSVKSSDSKFYCIQNDITFATVEDLNECTLTCG